jgi:hypothetical protein
VRYLHTLWVTLTIALPACKTAPQQNEGHPEPPLAWMDAMPKAPVDAIDAMAKGAREQFETKFSCPTDRVELKRRSDLEAAQPTASATPPDEVKADPGRYEKWKADQEKSRLLARASASDHQKFEVTGCGHTQVVDCRPHHAHGAVYPDWADCYEIR